MCARYVGETAEYRRLREQLLDAELELRDQRERIAALRRELPSNPVDRDYVFHEGPTDLETDDPIRETRLSELFDDGKDELILIHFMFDPSWEKGCPMCSMWADGYDAVARHVRERAAFAVVARQGIRGLRAWARHREWTNLRLLSASESSFVADFGMEDEFGQRPGASIFVREGDGSVRHTYTVEAMNRGGFRGVDLLSPVWHLFDLLPSGRGDWMPKHDE